MDTLVLVDVTDAHGMMLSRQRFRLDCPGPPLLIGRDLACDVVLNDPHVAARHASLSLGDDGSVRLADLGTVNGLIVGDARVREATVSGLDGAQVQVGHSHLRIRTAADRLAPERPDRESLRSRHREYAVTVLGALACAGFACFMAWISAPDDTTNTALSNLLRGAGVLGAWFTLWVLLGRAVRSRWHWSTNSAVTLGAAALGLWLWWGIEVGSFASGSPGVRIAGGAVILTVAAAAIYLQLRAATRLRGPTVAAIAAVLPLVGLVGYVWYQQPTGADVNRIAPPGRLFPPAWSRQPGTRPERFLEEALDLRDAADRGDGP
jgi:hypothetical protein